MAAVVIGHARRFGQGGQPGHPQLVDQILADLEDLPLECLGLGNVLRTDFRMLRPFLEPRAAAAAGIHDGIGVDARQNINILSHHAHGLVDFTARKIGNAAADLFGRQRNGTAVAGQYIDHGTPDVDSDEIHIAARKKSHLLDGFVHLDGSRLAQKRLAAHHGQDAELFVQTQDGSIALPALERDMLQQTGDGGKGADQVPVFGHGVQDHLFARGHSQFLGLQVAKSDDDLIELGADGTDGHAIAAQKALIQPGHHFRCQRDFPRQDLTGQEDPSPRRCAFPAQLVQRGTDGPAEPAAVALVDQLLRLFVKFLSQHVSVTADLPVPAEGFYRDSRGCPGRKGFSRAA